MERLCLETARALHRSYELTVIGPRGCAAFLPEGIRVFEIASSKPLSFLFRATLQITRLRNKSFDVVFGGSGVVAPVVAWFSALTSARSIVYVHGLDLVVENMLYRLFFLRALRRVDLAIANSRNTASLARDQSVAHGNIRVVNPPCALEGRVDSNAREFRQRFGLGDAPLLLSVGRLSQRKGIPEFLQYSFPSILKHHPNVRLLIIGGESPQALAGRMMYRAEDLGSLCGRLGLVDHVVLTGNVSDYELASAYSASAAHIFPIREIPGDVEGFGMVAVEAASFGLPTVAFNCGGVADAVASASSGYLIDPSKYDEFAMAVVEILHGNASVTSGSCRKFAAEFTPPRFASRLLHAVERPQ
jgi:phosphatidylinositol alpha-1,6-mannosyltransferase